MKKVISLVLAFAAVFLLSSCYAFLHADKLVYQGTLGKKIPAVNIDEDSLNVNASYAVE